jgi:hypothetical protein
MVQFIGIPRPAEEPEPVITTGDPAALRGVAPT